MNTSSTTAPVIIVTEERRRRRGLLWIVCGAALCATVMGGSTFALWSANAHISAGTVTAGDLNLTDPSPRVQFYDVSSDRLDSGSWPILGTPLKGHLINSTDTWRMVPGDRVAGSFSALVTLAGDNLVADLSAHGMESLTSTDNRWLTWTYELYLDGNLVVRESAVPAEAGVTMLRLAASEAGQGFGKPDATPDVTLPIGSDQVPGTVIALDRFGPGETRARVTFVVYGTFSAEAGDGFDDESRAGALSTSTLNTIGLTLQQVRTGPNFA